MYALSLTYNEYEMPDKAQIMRNKILNEYPHSLYAKLIKNPNYLSENKALTAQIIASYRNIYLTYEAQNYVLADSMINDAIKMYPDNDFEDKFVLLKAIIKGKQKNYSAYKTELSAFTEKYKSSSSIKYANELLEKANQIQIVDTTAKRNSLMPLDTTQKNTLDSLNSNLNKGQNNSNQDNKSGNTKQERPISPLIPNNNNNRNTKDSLNLNNK